MNGISVYWLSPSRTLHSSLLRGFISFQAGYTLEVASESHGSHKPAATPENQQMLLIHLAFMSLFTNERKLEYAHIIHYEDVFFLMEIEEVTHLTVFGCK